MAKYDMNSDLNKDVKLTFSDLIKEIMAEHPDYGDSYDSYYHLFKNHDKSGLIDLLNKELEFDIEKIAGESPQERFDMFKLLKLLFEIEKTGAPMYQKGFKDKPNIRTPFIKVLSNPRTANIKTPYSTVSVHGDIFEKVFEAVKNNVIDASQRIEQIDKANDYWETIVCEQFKYVYSDTALECQESALKELERIHRFLSDILKKLEGISARTMSVSERVFETFFNILLTHKKLCYENDRIQINYEVCLSPPVDEKYAECFLKKENEPVYYETIEQVKKYLNHYNANIFKEDEVEKITSILRYASYFEEKIPEADIKHYKYAFEKLNIVANWLQSEKPGYDFSNSIPFSVLITIIQEIVYLKKHVSENTLQINVTTIKPHAETLLSALKKESGTKSLLVQAWLRRIENRFSVNYGSWKLIEEKRKIEIVLYKIKSIIFDYRNLDDLLFANSLLARFAGRSTTSRIYAMEIGNQFAITLTAELYKRGITIENVLCLPEAKNTYDMFRELSYGEQKEKMIADVAMQIVNSIVETWHKTKSLFFITGTTIKFKYNKTVIKEAIFQYHIDMTQKIFLYKEFYMMITDEEKERYCSLGLDKFVL